VTEPPTTASEATRAAGVSVQLHGRTATVALDRPEVLNAFDAPMVDALISILRRFDRDGTADCLILTGTGRSFCTGADLRAVSRMTTEDYAAFTEQLRDLARKIRHSPMSVVAAVNGYALAGGLELACLCDFRIASDEAVFGMDDAAFNLAPTSGMTWLLPRLVGLGAAHYLAVSGETIDAQTARRMGLAQEVVPPDELMTRALALGQRIAALPSEGRRLTRHGINQGMETSHESALEWELAAADSCFADPITTQRVTRFLDRKDPDHDDR
jgi:enoyl-CoA hydratase/carnithine racemase